MYNKVLLFSAPSGAGHTRAAQATEKALQLINAGKEIKHVNVLEYTTRMYAYLYEQAYASILNTMPLGFKLAFELTNKPWMGEKIRLRSDLLNTRPLRRFIREYNPDLIVTSHFLTPVLTAHMKATGQTRAKLAIIVTDIDAHAAWLCRHYDQYFVATDRTRVYLEALGIDPSKISVYGIPIDPVFSVKKDKLEMRAKFGLRPDRTTILVSAGGLGLESIAAATSGLLKMKNPAQVVAICGKNAELKARLEQQASLMPANHHVSLTVVGFTKEMDEYMSAADILAGKPGGLTTAEARAKGLAMALLKPVPGQEERNSDWLLEEGAAIRCNDLIVLAYQLDKLVEDPTRLAAMQANSLRVARPNAALDIANKLVTLA